MPGTATGTSGRDDQHRAADGGQHVLGRAPQPLETLLVPPPQLRLRQPDRALDQGTDRRVECEGGPADVDDAEQGAGARVVDRCRGAVPRVLGLLEVLGGEQLHRGGLGQRRADRVRPHLLLGPHRALGDDHQEVRGVGDPWSPTVR
jgi:hypothetical protein